MEAKVFGERVEIAVDVVLYGRGDVMNETCNGIVTGARRLVDLVLANA